jgi:hypothetical protein
VLQQRTLRLFNWLCALALWACGLCLRSHQFRFLGRVGTFSDDAHHHGLAQPNGRGFGDRKRAPCR